jgi:hypothetical protein
MLGAREAAQARDTRGEQMTSSTCGFGGFCARLEGHMGAHTRSPAPAVQRWDERKRLLTERQWVLDYLDFPTPDIGELDDA